MLGIRLVLAYEPGASWLREGLLEPLWPVAERERIPVVLRMDHALMEIGGIAKRFPDLTFIVDHMGARTKPGPDAFDSLPDLLRIAEYRNVNVKMSCLPVYSDQPFPYKDLDATIKRVLDAYGHERLIWGSDLTRLCPPYRYVDVVDHFRVGCDFLTDEQRRAILGLNALRLYRWE
jgi:L-fuconolactonase